MTEFFSLHFRGAPFAILGPPHIMALTTLVVLNLLLIQFRGAREETRYWVRLVLAALLVVAQASWHLWNLAVGTWTVQWMLPLHACNILIWLSAVMLLRKDYRIYEFAYLLGIGGGLQYLATPDLGSYGYPHFRFFQALTSHGLLVTAPIYMTVVEGFRPTWQSLKRVVLWTNIYLIPVYLLNLAIGSNYLMLNAKPATPSILDLFPPWPYYVVFMEVLGLATCFLLYVPFLVMDYRAARVASRFAP